MTIQISVPEYGTTAEFPDDATPEQIQEVLARDYPPPSQTDANRAGRVSTFNDFRTPVSNEADKIVQADDALAQSHGPLGKELIDAAKDEEKDQAHIAGQKNSAINWTKSYKEFWDSRKRPPGIYADNQHPESPVPTTASDVPEIFRPVYTGKEPLDKDTLRRLGFNTDPMAQTMGQTVDTLNPNAWNLDDISVSVLGPEEHAKRKNKEAEGMFLHGGPQPKPERKPAGLWSLPIPTVREKIGEGISKTVNPLYGQMTGETPWLSEETMMVAPGMIAYGAMGNEVLGRITSKLGSWYRQVTIKERGLIAESLKDAIGRGEARGAELLKRGYSPKDIQIQLSQEGLTEGALLQRFKNPNWAKEAISKRATSETITPTPERPGVIPGMGGKGITKSTVSEQPGTPWEGRAYRSETGYVHDRGTTAADVVRYEQEELGNALKVDPKTLIKLKEYPAEDIAWVGKSELSVSRYGTPSELDLPKGSTIIATDEEGGYLVLKGHRNREVNPVESIGGRGMTRRTVEDLQALVEEKSMVPSVPRVDPAELLKEAKALDKDAGQEIYAGSPEDTSDTLIHVRQTFGRVTDTLDPAKHAITVEGGVGIGSESTVAKVYPDIYNHRAYGVTPEEYAKADFNMAKIDANVRGKNAEYLIRPSGPTLKMSSDISKMIMGRAKAEVEKAGFAPNDATATHEFYIKIAKQAGYGAIDTETPIGMKVIQKAKASPMSPDRLNKLAELHNTQKGLTVDPFEKQWVNSGTPVEIKKGYGVEMYPKHSLTLSSEKLTPEIFRHFMLTRARLLSVEGNHLGTEAIAGKSIMGVSRIFQDLQAAFEAGRIAKQERVYDFANNVSIDIPYGNEATGEIAPRDLGASQPTPREIKGDMLELSKTSNPTPTSLQAGVPGGSSVPVKGQEAIINDLAKKLSSRLDYGRIGKKNVAGTFAIIPENIRLKFRRDVESDVHETAHELQKFMGRHVTSPTQQPLRGKLAWKQGRALLQTESPAHFVELARIATRGNQADEGFAEFMSKYVTNDHEARTVCPVFYKFFDSKMELLFPEIRNALLQARKDYFDFINSSPLTQLHAMTAKYPDSGSRWSIDSIYTAVVDELHPLKKAVHAVAGGSEKMAFSKDPSILKELMQGWDGKVEAFIRYGTLNPVTLERVGPGLVERLSGVSDKIDEFRDFIILKRAAELIGKHQTGMSPKFISDATRDLANSLTPDEIMRLNKASEMFTDYNNALLVYAKDFLGEENVLKLMEMYPDYVPFYHLAPGGWQGKGVGTGHGSLFSPILKMRGTGSDQYGPPILDPIEATIKKTFAVIKAVEENKVRIAMKKMLRTHDGSGKYWRDVTKERYLAANVSLEEMLGAMGPAGKAFAQVVKDLTPGSEALLKMYANIFRTSSMVHSPDIAVYENGKMAILELNKDLYDVMVDMSPDTAGWMEKVIGGAANVLKIGATMTLEFSGANPIRDNFNAFLNSRYGFVPAVDFIKGLMHAIKKDEVYWAFQIGGGGRSLFNTVTRGLRVYEAEVEGQKWIPREFGKDLSEHPLRTGVKAGLLPLKGIYRVLSELAKLGELGTRLGEAGRALQEEASRGPLEATLRSAHAGQDVSVNFGQHGAKLRFMSQAIPFFNPAIQAVFKTGDKFKKSPLATSLKAISAITIPALGLYLLQKDDPRYQEVPDYFKQSSLIFLAPFKREDGSWCFKLSPEEYKRMTPRQKASMLSNTVWRFPLAPDLAGVFSYLPIRSLTHMAKTYDPALLGDVANALFSAVMPPFTMAVVTPMAELFANRTFHTGQQIEPTWMQEAASAPYRAYPYTSELAKRESRLISNLIHTLGVEGGVSPIKIDSFIRSAFGGLVSEAHRFASAGMGAIGLLPRIRTQISGSLADTPFFKRFAVRYPSASMQSSQDFYDMCSVYDAKLQDIKNSTTPGHLVSLEDAHMEIARGGKLLANYYSFLNNEHPVYGMSIAGIKEDIQILRKATMAIYNDETHFTPEQRTLMINRSYFMINDLAKTGIKIILNKHTDVRPGVPDAGQIGQ